MKTVKRILSLSLVFIMLSGLIWEAKPVQAGTVKYDVWVAGTRVTSDNADNVLGDWRVSYDNYNRILTLNNATIDTNDYGIYAKNLNLTIELIGVNSITTDSKHIIHLKDDKDDGLYYIKGPGKLTAKSRELFGFVFFGGKTTIMDATIDLDMSKTMNKGWSGIGAEDLIIDNSNIKIRTGYTSEWWSYGLSARNLQVNKSKLNITSGDAEEDVSRGIYCKQLRSYDSEIIAISGRSEQDYATGIFIEGTGYISGGTVNAFAYASKDKESYGIQAYDLKMVNNPIITSRGYTRAMHMTKNGTDTISYSDESKAYVETSTTIGGKIELFYGNWFLLGSPMNPYKRVFIRKQADKTKLVETLEEANKAKEGVKVSTDGSDVYKVEQWVTQKVMDDFNNLIEEATEANKQINANQGSVDLMVSLLEEGIDKFNAAKTAGLKDVVKTALEEKIVEADSAKVGIKISVNGKDIAKNKKWVTQTVMDAFDAAINKAITTKDKADATQAEVDQAVIDLQAAIDAFKAEIKPGTKAAKLKPAMLPVDDSEFQESIDEAENEIADTEISSDGKDISEKEDWVEKSDSEELEKAIEEAKSILEKAEVTQEEIDKAMENLKAAIDKFQKSKNSGRKEKFEESKTELFSIIFSPAHHSTSESKAKPKETQINDININLETRLTIGSKTLEKTVDGTKTEIPMDAEPFIVDGRTMVPIRFVAEALGFEVDWLEESSTVILRDGMNRIEIPVKTNKIIVNGKEYESDVAPILKEGRTFIAVANVARALGLKDDKDVIWLSESQEVIIKREINVKK